MPRRRTKTAEERFWRMVEKKNNDECWEWKGYKNKKGYGTLNINGLMYRTNRLAFIFSGRIITKEKPFVLHKCDNPACCNPAHLFSGNCQDNIKDMMLKGRSLKGEKNWNSKLCENDIKIIRSLETKMPVKDIAKKYSMTPSGIYSILRRQTWKHI